MFRCPIISLLMFFFLSPFRVLFETKVSVIDGLGKETRISVEELVSPIERPTVCQFPLTALILLMKLIASFPVPCADKCSPSSLKQLASMLSFSIKSILISFR